MELEQICQFAVRYGASDIHLKAGHPPLLRVDGSIRTVDAPALTREAIATMIWNSLGTQQRERFREEKGLDFSYEVSSVGRFRVNIFRQRGMIGAVLRVIPSQVKTLTELRLPTVLSQLTRKERGLVLMTGTTGSGKSSTVSAFIEEINRTRAAHVITIEDPIEFTFEDKRSIVNQREIGVDARSFPEALRAALRQDPDVLIIGEIRDRETMEIALHAAETGHLVVATLHGMDAVESLTRITDFFPPYHQPAVRRSLSHLILAIISQRLIKQSKGGRIAAVEIMMNSGMISECIADEKKTSDIRELLPKLSGVNGSQSFDQALYWYHQEGILGRSEVLRAANRPEDLELRLQGLAGEEWLKPGSLRGG